MSDVRRLEGQVALVTGSSRGIGASVAKLFAKEGARVAVHGRDEAALQKTRSEIEAEGGSVMAVDGDVTRSEDIERMRIAIEGKFGAIDILVANAGVLGTISPIGHVEAKTFEKVMTINVTSTWRLIRSVDPLLRLSDAGRAIILSSNAAHSARAFWGPYAASKAAVETLMRSWADETRSYPLRVNAADPGATRTAMRAQAVPGEDPDTLPHPSEIAARLLPMASAELTRTGQIYQARHDRWVSCQQPA